MKNELTPVQMTIAKEILERLGYDSTEEDVQRHFDTESITINTGRDDEDYVWYEDESDCICIRIKDGYELSEAEIEEQFL